MHESTQSARFAHLVPLRVVPPRVAQVSDVQDQAQLGLHRSRRLCCSGRPAPNLGAAQVVFKDPHRSEGRGLAGVPGVELGMWGGAVGGLAGRESSREEPLR